MSALLQETEAADWPGGEVHKFIMNIEKHFKLTITISNKLKLEIKKEQEIDEIDWKKNTNPQIIWKAISKVSLKYYKTFPVTKRDKIKWITKKAPQGYNKTIGFTSTK